MVYEYSLHKYSDGFMAAKHGTRRQYLQGCRCDDCTAADRAYKREYYQRKAAGEPPRIGTKAPVAQPELVEGPGVVESAVLVELEGLEQAVLRPGLVQTALALARTVDKATTQQPAAARQLTEILDKLHKGADARKSRLASVRQMTGSKTG